MSHIGTADRIAEYHLVFRSPAFIGHTWISPHLPVLFLLMEVCVSLTRLGAS